MNINLNDKHITALYEAISSLESTDEVKAFFDDLCTVFEIKAMAQRLEVAKLLDMGIVYNEIASKTSASTATISRVNRSLSYGSGGYKTVIKRNAGKE